MVSQVISNGKITQVSIFYGRMIDSVVFRCQGNNGFLGWVLRYEEEWIQGGFSQKTREGRFQRAFCPTTNNMRSHTARRSANVLQQLNWKVLKHLACSTDQAPCDFNFFGTSRTLWEHRPLGGSNEGNKRRMTVLVVKTNSKKYFSPMAMRSLKTAWINALRTMQIRNKNGSNVLWKLPTEVKSSPFFESKERRRFQVPCTHPCKRLLGLSRRRI